MKTHLLAGFVALAFAGASTQARAAVIQLTSPASVSAGDTTLVYPGAVGTVFSSPVSFTAGGNTLTFSAALGALELDQVGVTYGSSAFSNGTRILIAGGFQGPTAPITISFANPVSEFGVNAEEFNTGDYTVSFTAFDGARPLGTFTATGNDPSILSFEGARTTGGDVITSVLISDNASNNVGLGPFSFGNPTATSVPEPASLVLIISGLLGLSLVRPWRKVA